MNTELLAAGMLLTLYDANLRAIFSSSETTVQAYDSFDDINANIRDKKIILLLGTFADNVYDIINYTMTPQFESLRNALAVNPAILIVNHK